jgi:small nuclear ribonucleoprotein B and B'
LRYVEHRLRVTLQDGRVVIGTFLAFDKHLNLVLSDTEEFRTLRNKKDRGVSVVEERQEKRTLGLIILRGETVVSIAVEGPPPSSTSRLTPGGPGVAKGAGRGTATSAPVGLGAAPVHGVGVGNMGGLPGSSGLPPPPGMGRGMY